MLHPRTGNGLSFNCAPATLLGGFIYAPIFQVIYYSNLSRQIHLTFSVIDSLMFFGRRVFYCKITFLEWKFNLQVFILLTSDIFALLLLFYIVV